MREETGKVPCETLPSPEAVKLPGAVCRSAAMPGSAPKARALRRSDYSAAAEVISPSVLDIASSTGASAGIFQSASISRGLL